MTIQKGKWGNQRKDQSPKPKLQHPKTKGRKKKTCPKPNPKPKSKPLLVAWNKLKKKKGILKEH